MVEVDRSLVETSFTFSFDPQLGAESGTTDFHNAFRLSFWAKDHGVGKLEEPLRASNSVVAGFARAAELVFVDVPIAAYATVLPHELLGHGARIRELGGEASYQFDWPPPYGFTPSYTVEPEPIDIPIADAPLLVQQAGIGAERYEARASLRSAFESGTLNHIDSGLLVGIPIHEVFEPTLPWETNDARAWTTLQATRYGVSAEGVQDRYLVATAITGFANPAFVYAAYDLFWRFLVAGERTGPMSALSVGETGLWVDHPREPDAVGPRVRARGAGPAPRLWWWAWLRIGATGREDDRAGSRSTRAACDFFRGWCSVAASTPGSSPSSTSLPPSRSAVWAVSAILAVFAIRRGPTQRTTRSPGRTRVRRSALRTAELVPGVRVGAKTAGEQRSRAGRRGRRDARPRRRTARASLSTSEWGPSHAGAPPCG